ncbi:hypothetical protein QTJ16_006107 [Diplocarpon rosae]|uniref:DUF2461 domain-containing protein n=1 Tax=Diplocarpon rosae TaxID=946125 RepID=A0AAD9SW92_9HELO|nr:hypothetical protein QTJ16_006107 [Diplocarpon rosae]PBP23784.1 hypothetical protein BUE80_DR005427 [Diplocarpon rosae]
MPVRKRKATTPPLASTPRRQSGRAKRVQVVYAESDAECPAFSDDAEVSDEAEVDDYEEDADMDEEAVTKSSAKGWRKVILPNGNTQMEIDIPTAKPAGDTPYEEGRIHQNTLEFLRELRRNNKREWLKFHDAVFRQAEKDFNSFITNLSSLLATYDPTLPDLPPRDLIHRIHRDMRFTPDPTPYKPYFSASWSRAGRKGPYAHYYLHVQPGEDSFVGGGYFGCDNETLACLREDVDTQPHQLKSVLMGEQLRGVFFPTAQGEERVVKAFCEMSKQNALKKKPKGFDADHKDIEILKLRNYVLTKKLSDKDVVGKNALQLIGSVMEALQPFITYLNNTVMPDRN